MLTIYKASAGSGKTFHLAYSYIKLLLGEYDTDNQRYNLALGRKMSHAPILAVTFTNKATQEMKERIVAELAKLASNPEESDYLDKLHKDLNTTDTAAISQAAREALASLLFRFSQFNISTIDSFFQQILRAFAIEIDRPGNFAVELDDKMMLDMAVDELFENLDSDKDIKDWIRLFMEFRFEQEQVVNIFDKESGLHANLVDTLSSFMSEYYRLNRKTIDSYLRQSGRVNEYYNYLTRNLIAIKTKVRALADAAYKAAEPYKTRKDVMKLLSNLALTGTADSISDTIRSIASSNPDGAFLKGAGADVPDDVKQKITDVLNLFITTFDRVNFAQMLRKQLFFFGLLGKVTAITERICRENNMILLSNTNELINGIIGENPVVAPFIYERVGSRLHNYLIDEFQDTSELQWLNMKPLLLEGLSALNEQLIIGDEKQCIYRFRNSKPELLSSQVYSEMKGVTTVDVRGNRIVENTNWRSAPEVVRFNNTLFYQLGHIIDPLSAYSHVMQGVAKKNLADKGHVKIRHFDGLITQSGEKKKGEKPQKLKTAELEEVILNEMVEELKRLFRHYKPGEIAILVDTNKQGEKIISRLLRAMEPDADGSSELQRFEIISNDALTVASSSAVKILVNRLRLIESPDKADGDGQDNSAAGQWKKRTEAEFAALENEFEKHYSNLRAVMGSAAGRALANALYDFEMTPDMLLAEAERHQLNDLVSVVERLISELSPRILDEENIFITAFQDLVVNFSVRAGSDVRAFLNWWDKTGCKSKINSPENKNALVVSTIHKSKGLEFPCVIIPFANWVFCEDSSPSKPIFNWFELKEPVFNDGTDFAPAMLPLHKSAKLAGTPLAPQYEQLTRQQKIDALNLTYVAFTRAKRELVVFTQDPYQNKSEGIAHYIEEALSQSYREMMERLEAGIDGVDSDEMELLRGSLIDFGEHYDAENRCFDYGVTNRRDLELKEERRKENMKVRQPESDNEYPHVSEPMNPYEAYRIKSNIKFMRLASDEDFDPENARIKGIFMHHILSKVVRPSSLRYACIKRGQEINLSRDLIEERYHQLKKAIEYEPARRWFHDTRRVAVERQLFDRNDAIELRRPDRIVWTADGYIDVVDFKFGDRANIDKYRYQVRRYVNHMRAAGYRNVRGYLWYPLEDYIVAVDEGDDNNSLI
ncbi:MAG: UvrD-helicase domain-containing protein [Muribaculaceae bacterium]|nr:UvrD-helicase domain-containing protein [Muribaculaceae bacterium]